MKPFYWLIYSLARLFFKVCFRLEIHGIEHIRPGSGLLAANHTSFYDPPVVSISCPEEVHFLARESLFRFSPFAWLIRNLNTHPVAKGGSDIQTLKLMVQLLKEGKKIIVFPEGSRSSNGELQPFQRGIAFLAQKGECPIYPIYVEGTFSAWPRGRKRPKFFGKIHCVFGSPIDWNEFAPLPKKEAEAEIPKRSREAVLALKQWLAEGAKGTPP